MHARFTVYCGVPRGAWQGEKVWKAITTLQEVLYFWEQVEKDKFVRRRTGIFFIGIYLVETLIRQLGG